TEPVALENLDRRRLAGAVRAEQAEDLADGDGEVDAADGLVAVVRLAEPADLDGDQRWTATKPAGGKSGGGPAVSSAAMRGRSGWGPTPSTVSPRPANASRTLSTVAPGASRSSISGRTPTARPTASAVWRARTSGLVRMTAGRMPFAASS